MASVQSVAKIRRAGLRSVGASPCRHGRLRGDDLLVKAAVQRGNSQNGTTTPGLDRATQEAGRIGIGQVRSLPWIRDGSPDDASTLKAFLEVPCGDLRKWV